MKATPALVLIIALLAASAAADSPAAPIGCAPELLAMSKCVSYLAAALNDESASPSAACCEVFSAAAFGDAGGGVGCLCYLVRNSSMLGFPLNVSHIANLFSSCNAVTDAAILVTHFTWICRVEALPPLSIPPYVKPVVPAVAPPEAPAINGTDHGNMPIPTKPELSVGISVELWDLVLFLVMSLICFMEAGDLHTWARSVLLLGALMFFMLALDSFSVTVNH